MRNGIRGYHHTVFLHVRGVSCYYRPIAVLDGGDYITESVDPLSGDLHGAGDLLDLASIPGENPVRISNHQIAFFVKKAERSFRHYLTDCP